MDETIESAGGGTLRELGRMTLTAAELAERFAIERRHGGALDGVRPHRADVARRRDQIAADRLSRRYAPLLPPTAPRQPGHASPEVRAAIVAGWPAFRARFPGLLAADVATLYGRRCTGMYGVSVSRTTLFTWQRALLHRGGHAA